MHGEEHLLCNTTSQPTCVAFPQPSEEEAAPLHLKDGETEARRGSGTCLGPTAEKGAGCGPGVPPTCPQGLLLKGPFLAQLLISCLSPTSYRGFFVVFPTMDAQGWGPAGPCVAGILTSV